MPPIADSVGIYFAGGSIPMLGIRGSFVMVVSSPQANQRLHPIGPSGKICVEPSHFLLMAVCTMIRVLIGKPCR